MCFGAVAPLRMPSGWQGQQEIESGCSLWQVPEAVWPLELRCLRNSGALPALHGLLQVLTDRRQQWVLCPPGQARGTCCGAVHPATAASLVCAAARPCMGPRGRRRCESRAQVSKQAPAGCSIQGGLRVRANLLRKAVMSCEIIILQGAAMAPTALTPGMPASGLCAQSV